MPHNLPGHLTKLQAALDRVYPPDEKEKMKSAAGNKPADVASMTAAQVREKQEREVQDSALRTRVGVKINVARGIIALQERRYEEAGRLMGRVTEDGGMGEWEGTVRATIYAEDGADDRLSRLQMSASSRRFAF
jgi:COP9 signalosome complex subunit 1